MSNPIKPDHYNNYKYKPIDVITDWGLNFNLGNSVKYLSRAGKKDDIIQDLEKAKWYIQYEIERIKKLREAEQKDNFSQHLEI